jgi:predicted RNA-binding protein YlqC (UPF0109 family)
MLNSDINIPHAQISKPDYDGLVRFLIEPLLESPELLSFDCENISSTKRVWIRLAFEDNDKGKIYGRGGRNIQAVRNVLQTAAKMAGETLYLEIYENKERSRMKRSRSTFRKPQINKDIGNNFERRPRKRRRSISKPKF